MHAFTHSCYTSSRSSFAHRSSVLDAACVMSACLLPASSVCRPTSRRCGQQRAGSCLPSTPTHPSGSRPRLCVRPGPDSAGGHTPCCGWSQGVGAAGTACCRAERGVYGCAAGRVHDPGACQLEGRHACEIDLGGAAGVASTASGAPKSVTCWVHLAHARPSLKARQCELQQHLSHSVCFAHAALFGGASLMAIANRSLSCATGVLEPHTFLAALSLCCLLLLAPYDVHMPAGTRLHLSAHLPHSSSTHRHVQRPHLPPVTHLLGWPGVPATPRVHTDQPCHYYFTRQA
jgi:hypothetical protein